jgi:hypothetical protein
MYNKPSNKTVAGPKLANCRTEDDDDEVVLNDPTIVISTKDNNGSLNQINTVVPENNNN